MSYSIMKNKSADVSIIFERLRMIKLAILYQQAFIQKSNAKIKTSLGQNV